MVFYFIGLGLSNPEDISVRGLRLVQGAKRVYLEMYTAILADWNFTRPYPAVTRLIC
ncbi:unnamed protein product [Oikopleura dioica]|uniref:Tetrapyrrole methylase domain-containing protein n=1 Tax=Oikopleura dioica TaxID=34765 RepID=E4YIA0_OIKDI|nr:unnamed protein product [Oikopleura dioica]